MKASLYKWSLMTPSSPKGIWRHFYDCQAASITGWSHENSLSWMILRRSHASFVLPDSGSESPQGSHLHLPLPSEQLTFFLLFRVSGSSQTSPLLLHDCRRLIPSDFSIKSLLFIWRSVGETLNSFFTVRVLDSEQQPLFQKNLSFFPQYPLMDYGWTIKRHITSINCLFCKTYIMILWLIWNEHRLPWAETHFNILLNTILKLEA